MTDHPIGITDHRVTPSTAMRPEQHNEIIDLLLRHGIDAYRTTWVDYDLVDGQPVLRTLLYVFDELGYPQAASDGTIVTETVTAPLVGPLPSWWRPAGAGA